MVGCLLDIGGASGIAGVEMGLEEGMVAGSMGLVLVDSHIEAVVVVAAGMQAAGGRWRGSVSRINMRLRRWELRCRFRVAGR